jgi:hypothetical protein
MANAVVSIPVASLRRHDADLEWYFSGAHDADLGLRSNFGAGQGRDARDAEAAADAEERRVEASRRDKRVRARLWRLDDPAPRVLEAYYKPHRLDVHWFGRAAPVVLVLPAFVDAYARYLEKLVEAAEEARGAAKANALPAPYPSCASPLPTAYLEGLDLRLRTRKSIPHEVDVGHALRRGAELATLDAHRAYHETAS